VKENENTIENGFTFETLKMKEKNKIQHELQHVEEIKR
jgi:hypothetical protein